MTDRNFDELDLREMLDNASSFRENHEPDRFVIETRHGNRPWEVIVEPLSEHEGLLVITAYPVD